MSNHVRCNYCKHRGEVTCKYKNSEGVETGEDWRKYSTYAHFCKNFDKFILKDEHFASRVIPQIKQNRL